MDRSLRWMSMDHCGCPWSTAGVHGPFPLRWVSMNEAPPIQDRGGTAHHAANRSSSTAAHAPFQWAASTRRPCSGCPRSGGSQSALVAVHERRGPRTALVCLRCGERCGPARAGKGSTMERKGCCPLISQASGRGSNRYQGPRFERPPNTAVTQRLSALGVWLHGSANQPRRRAWNAEPVLHRTGREWVPGGVECLVEIPHTGAKR